jgi:hypothetical protein
VRPKSMYTGYPPRLLTKNRACEYSGESSYRRRS